MREESSHGRKWGRETNEEFKEMKTNGVREGEMGPGEGGDRNRDSQLVNK